MDPEKPSQQESERTRRGCLGCFFTSSLGCFAFLVGCFLAATGFAPSMLGGPAARLAESWLEDALDGDVTIDDLELSWNWPQEAKGVRVLDPDGNQVLELELTLPSMLEMLDSDSVHWDLDISIRSADIVVAEDGITNLERAFAFQGDLQSTRRPRLRFGAFRADRGLDQRFRLALDVRGDGIRLRHGGATEPFAKIDELDLSSTHGSGRDDTVRLTARVSAGEQSGTIGLEGRLDAAPSGLAGPVDIEADWTDFPSVLVDELVARGGIVRDVVGERVTGKLSLDGDFSKETVLVASMEGPDGERAELSGTIAGGVLREGANGSFAADLRVPVTRCEQRLSPFLPAGTGVTRADDHALWSLRAESFALPLGIGTQDGFDAELLLRGLSGSFQVRPASRIAFDDSRDELCRLSDVLVTLGFTSNAPPALDVTATVSTAGDSPISGKATLVVQGEGTLDEVLAGGALRADLHAPSLPTRLLDHLTGQGGLLTDVLGEVVSLHLDTSDLVLPLGETLFEIETPDERASLSGIVDAQGVRGAGAQKLRVDLPVTEHVKSEVFARILPWLNVVDRPAGADPAWLLVEEYHLPFDRDPTPVQAQIRLHLGELRYRLLPGFHRLFHRGGTPEIIAEKVPLMRMNVGRQIVSYEELALGFGMGDEENEEYDFIGTLDLRTGLLSMQGEVSPAMAMRRPDAEDDSGVLVLVNVSGQWARPQLSVDSQLFEALTDQIDDVMRAFTDDGQE